MPSTASGIQLAAAAALAVVLAGCGSARHARGPEPTAAGYAGCGVDQQAEIACPETRDPAGHCPPSDAASGRYDDPATRENQSRLRGVRRTVHPSADSSATLAALDRAIAVECCYAHCSQLPVVASCVAPACGGQTGDQAFFFCVDHPSGLTSLPAAAPFSDCPAALAAMGAGKPSGFDRGGGFDATTTRSYRHDYGPPHRCCYRALTYPGEFYQ